MVFLDMNSGTGLSLVDRATAIAYTKRATNPIVTPGRTAMFCHSLGAAHVVWSLVAESRVNQILESLHGRVSDVWGSSAQSSPINSLTRSWRPYLVVQGRVQTTAMRARRTKRKAPHLRAVCC